ncbi:hypothetical protein V3C99_007072 [Haemonchus contortus]|nr:unnamed protein product [Haemonchus contortus]
MSPNSSSGLHQLLLGLNDLERRKRAVSDNIQRRIKSANMVPAENELLFQMVARNFREFNTKFLVVAGKKRGNTSRQRLLEYWAAQITALGFSSRSPEQIHEKVRKAVDRCRRSIIIEKRAALRGLPEPHHSDIPYYLEPLKQVLLSEAEEAQAARPTMVTVDDDDGYCDSKEAVQNEIRAMNAQRPTSTPSFDTRSFKLPSTSQPGSSDLPSRSTPETDNGPLGAFSSLFDDAPSTSSMSCMDKDDLFDSNMKLALLQAELRAVEMKREYYAKKMKLAEAQMELTALQIERYRLINEKYGSQRITE